MAAQGHAYDIITVKRRLRHLRSPGRNSAHVTAAAGPAREESFCVSLSSKRRHISNHLCLKPESHPATPLTPHR